MRQALQRLVRALGQRLKQRQGHLRANHCRRLQQAFLLRRQAVNTRRQHRLHRGRHLNTHQRLGQPIRAALAH